MRKRVMSDIGGRGGALRKPFCTHKGLITS